MRSRSVVVSVGIVLIAGFATLGATYTVPHLLLQSGVVSSVAPTFDTSIYLVASYVGGSFELNSKTTLTVLPDIFLFGEAGLSFSPGEVSFGVDAGLGIVPFWLESVDVWAEAPAFESRLGEEGNVLLTGDAGGVLWLGSGFGGGFYLDVIAEIEGETNTVVFSSDTTIGYDMLDGLALDEELGARVEFQAPRFFGGQLLAEDDLSMLVGYVTARLRLNSLGLSVPGIVVGLEVSVESPLQDGSGE
ncbi:MAG: hypothetical protein WBC63_05885 [Candidatus Bipolaricaulia bacterium]